MRNANQSTTDPRQNNPSILGALASAVLFGLVFVLIVVAALFVWSYLDRRELNYWHWSMMYEYGGFPCLGIFSITSASYFAMRMTRWRFVECLFWIACGAMACFFVAGFTGFLPRFSKGHTTPYWQEPEYFICLTVPSWLMAIVLIAINAMKRRNSQQPTSQST